MLKKTISFSVSLLLCAFVFLSSPATAAKFKVEDGPELDIWGRAQLTFEQFDREDDKSDDLEFDADRVRFGTKMKWGAWKAALQFDANGAGKKATTLDGFIRDAYAEYKFDDAFAVRLGQFKTPSGMSNNESSSRLPMAKRTMVSRLTVDRALGVAVKGKYVGGSKETGGFGYQAGIFNAADRGKAVKDISSSQKGDDMSYVGSVFYDYGKMLHVEASWGRIERAGGPDITDDVLTADKDETFTSEDYDVWDLGARFKQGPIRIRAEYIDGSDVQGQKDWDEEAWFVEGAYRINDMVEGVVRWQNAECDDCKGQAGVNQELSRFEVGLNLFLGQNDRNGRVQLNYVNVGRDEEDYSGVGGGSDNRYDAILGQLQFMF